MAETHALQWDATEALGEWKSVAQALQDKTPLLKIIGNLMLGSIRQTFREEGVPAGSWRRVFAGTIQTQFERRGKKATTKSGTQSNLFTRFARSKHLLYAQGTLVRSVNFEVRPEESATVIGSALKYARIHQFGGVIVPRTKKFLRFAIGGGKFMFAKRVTIPARPYIVLRPEDPGRMGEGMRDYLIAKFGTRDSGPGAGEKQ